MKVSEYKIVEVDDIGLISFKSSKKYKGISIKLKPFKGIEVSYPSYYSRKSAIEFVKTKKDWIHKAQEKIKIKENQLTIFDENTDFKTKNFVLQIQKHAKTDVFIKLKNGILNVYYPENVDVSHPSVQESIRLGIEKSMRLEAKKVLPARISQLASQYGFVYNRVFIKNLNSRWGSCSSMNNINLNLHLMRFPEHLIDYVILHELCHTIEKNHGSGFWNLLNKYTDNKAKSLAKELKNFGTKIY